MFVSAWFMMPLLLAPVPALAGPPHIRKVQGRTRTEAALTADRWVSE
ncbi:hypothetical protein [Deinococcus sonorensis]|uniref:Uncharacterized protein n=2 Tax=Deinococcus sonorensis TaxID=309891 RepID=A0AAU7U525_9DEIO